MKNIIAISILLMGGFMFSFNNTDNDEKNIISPINETVIENIPWNAPPFEGTIPEEKILKRVNNQKSKDDLITQTFPEDVLLRYKDTNICISNIDAECSIECLRQVSDTEYYAIFKSSENGILYLLFKRDEVDGYLRTSMYWYVKKPLKYEDFEKLTIGKSKESDVKSIDPYGIYTVDYAGEISHISDNFYTSDHLTSDGYKVTILYDWNSELEQYYVSDMNIQGLEENDFYKCLLTSDRPSF